MDDALLLSRYVETGCQESFEQIVTRHSGWVYSVSLRAVRDRHLDEDVTQAVFRTLARKAKTTRPGTPLPGWLSKASRFAVSDALKFFFFNNTATTEIYTLSLHDALPIFAPA